MIFDDNDAPADHVVDYNDDDDHDDDDDDDGKQRPV